MKREIQHIIDDYINLSDHRELINESKNMLNEDSNIIIELLEKLFEATLKQEYKRNQLRDRFLSYLLLLNEDKMIPLAFQIVKKFNVKINIKQLADKVVFFSSSSKILNEIRKKGKDQELIEFNNLPLGELVLRGKLKNFNLFEDLIKDDLNWVGLELSPIEQGLSLRSHTINGGGFGYNFGLSNEPKTKYQFHDFGHLILKRNIDDKLNQLASTIAKNYITVLEFGDISYIDQSIMDTKSEIICQLSYAETQDSEVELAFRRLDKKEVYNNLFCMSVLGGAYERGEFHATSRINSWKVISSLMQKDYKTSTKDEISKLMDDYEWTEFTCNNEWFMNEIIDLGIIGINSVKNKYAIIAITDTD